MDRAEAEEVARRFLTRRFEGAEVSLTRIYVTEAGIELSGSLRLPSGVVKRFTITIDRERGEVRGYGLR